MSSSGSLYRDVSDRTRPDVRWRCPTTPTPTPVLRPGGFSDETVARGPDYSHTDVVEECR